MVWRGENFVTWSSGLRFVFRHFFKDMRYNKARNMLIFTCDALPLQQLTRSIQELIMEGMDARLVRSKIGDPHPYPHNGTALLFDV